VRLTGAPRNRFASSAFLLPDACLALLSNTQTPDSLNPANPCTWSLRNRDGRSPVPDHRNPTAEENPRQHRRGAALLPCSRRSSNTRVPTSKLGEGPSAEERQLKATRGICKENGAKRNRAAENHQASKRLSLVSRQSTASLPRTGHTAAAKTLLGGRGGETSANEASFARDFCESRARRGYPPSQAHLPRPQLWREGAAVSRSGSVKEREHEGCLAAAGEKALHKQIYSRLHPHKHPSRKQLHRTSATADSPGWHARAHSSSKHCSLRRC